MTSSKTTHAETTPRKKTAKGRPRGARTADREIVTEITIVAQCSCGSTAEPINQRTAREGKASGTIKGLSYGYFQHVRCNCADCGKALLLRRFSADPLPQ